MTVDMGVMIEGVATAVVNQSHKRIRSTDDMQMKTTAVLAEQRTPIRYLVCHSAKSSCSNLHLLAAKSHPFSLKSTVLIAIRVIVRMFLKIFLPLDTAYVKKLRIVALCTSQYKQSDH